MKPKFIAKYDLFPKLRLYSGLILMVYAFTHLLNHSVGVISLDWMERGRLVFVGFWRHPLLSWLVPTALTIHFVLALYKLYRKTTYRGMRRSEWTQIVLGLLIPPLLMAHLIETRISRLYFHIDDTYSFLMGSYGAGYLILWILALLIIWIHGTIGLSLFLRQKDWYDRWRSAFRVVSIGLPVFASLGVVAAMKETLLLRQDPAWMEAVRRASNAEGIDWVHQVDFYAGIADLTYLMLIGAVFTARYIRLKRRARRKNVVVNYLDGRSISVHEGTTLLEASLKARIPHAHVCGGRGRCSTCRIKVVQGMEHISPPGEEELILLKKVQMGQDVRLACKSTARGEVTIHPLLNTGTGERVAYKRRPDSQGADKEIAILFSDIRGFTALTEHKLPFDVVFILNQYYQFMGEAIEACGGKVDKFIGDGIMALFGLDSGLQTGCAQALNGAREMSKQLVRLNETLKNELDQPLEMGIGIHCGSVIVGEMGYLGATTLTAIGDVANTSSRLEGVCKELGCQLIISEEVARNAGADLSAFPSHEIQIRGRSQPMVVYSLDKASELEQITLLSEV